MKTKILADSEICISLPLTDYANNPVYPTFQELPSEGNYFSTANKIIYLDMRASKDYTGKLAKLKHDDIQLVLKVNLKAPITKKVRFQNWGYS